MDATRRALLYSAVGVAADAAFSALHDGKRGRPVRWRTSPWMVPIYALLLPLYEPLHDRIRERPALQRAAAYGCGFLAVEYATGRSIRGLTRSAPWDYSYARGNLHGLIRAEYFFLWAAAGLALEPLHDKLAGGESGCSRGGLESP